MVVRSQGPHMHAIAVTGLLAYNDTSYSDNVVNLPLTWWMTGKSLADLVEQRRIRKRKSSSKPTLFFTLSSSHTCFKSAYSTVLFPLIIIF